MRCVHAASSSTDALPGQSRARQRCNARLHVIPQLLVPRPAQRAPRVRATPGDEGNAGDPTPDIDQLASQLAAEAAKLRQSLDGDEPLAGSWDAGLQADIEEGAPDPPSPLAALGPFGGQLSVEAQAAVLEEVGEGGFIGEDFQLIQELGRLRVQQVSTSGTDSPHERQAAVVAWAARYRSGMPYQAPVNVLVKEVLPWARTLACNELLVMQRLAPMPRGDKWQAAAKDADNAPPVVPLLGYFWAPPSDVVCELSGTNKDSLWLVYKWEGLRPASMLMQPAASADPWAPRQRLLRAVARGVLQALAYCHECGVVHGSLSPGSVLLSSTEDADADRLVVRLSSFGFGRLLTPPVGNDSPLGRLAPQLLQPEREAATLRQQDLQAAALLLGELFSAATATGSGEGGAGGGWLDAPALQRLLFDVFNTDGRADMALFKDYCLQDVSLSEFVRFMDADEGAGWVLLAALVEGSTDAATLLNSNFCRMAVA